MPWKRLATLCTLLSLSFLVDKAAAETSLAPHHATYKVKISVLGGEMHSGLEVDGADYHVTSTVIPKGIARIIARGTIQENSRFSIVNGKAQPSTYSSSDSLSKNGHDVQMVFNWNAHEVVGELDGLPYKSTIENNVIDRATLQYALMFDLLNDQLQQEYLLLEADGVKKLVVSSKGQKSVRVPFGEFDVIGIVHRAESSSRETTLWCAPSLGYLPVVIEQYRNGKVSGTIELVDYQHFTERS